MNFIFPMCAAQTVTDTVINLRNKQPINTCKLNGHTVLQL